MFARKGVFVLEIDRWSAEPCVSFGWCLGNLAFISLSNTLNCSDWNHSYNCWHHNHFSAQTDVAERHADHGDLPGRGVLVAAPIVQERVSYWRDKLFYDKQTCDMWF